MKEDLRMRRNTEAGRAITASNGRRVVLCALLAGAVLAGSALAQSAKAAPAPGALAQGSGGAAAAAPRRVSPYAAQQLTPKAKTYYAAAWGVDSMKVRYTSSGNLIRFSYRVADPELAKALSNKAAAPYLVGQKNNVALQVPVMDKVGQLRQTAAPQAGQEYWMVFSNKGNLVRPGDRVNVLIGQFHANGLVVE
jgi:hypothetical protein